MRRSLSRITRRIALVLAAVTAEQGAHEEARAREPSDETAVCIAAVEQAQLARFRGKLRAARDSFATCARDVCPGPIRTDCARWLQDADARMPTAVFVSEWQDSTPAAGLRVVVDGETLEGDVEAHAVPLDPGEHAFRFTVDGGIPLEARYTIREGDKNRVFHLAFARIAPPGIPASREPSRSRVERPIPPAVYVAAGIGVAGLAAFAVLGILGQSQVSSMESSCKPNCPSSEVDAAGAKLLAGDIAGYAGAGALGVAALLYLARPIAAVAPKATARLGADAHGASVLVEVSF